jgi:hypothetical protein
MGFTSALKSTFLLFNRQAAKNTRQLNAEMVKKVFGIFLGGMLICLSF